MYRADAKSVNIKTDEGKHLFSFDPATRTIEIVERGETFLIPMWLIEEHIRTSNLDKITVYAEPHEPHTPCGHNQEWVLDAYLNKVCPICGQ